MSTVTLSRKKMKSLIPTSKYHERKLAYDIFEKAWQDSSKLQDTFTSDDGEVEVTKYLQFNDSDLTLKFTMEEFTTRRIYGKLLVSVNKEYYSTSVPFEQMITELDEIRVLLKAVEWK